MHFISFLQLGIFCRGFLMGLADLVPGVSGGTIALVTGIYKDLMQAISSLNGKNFRLLLSGHSREFFHKVQGRFLLSLFFGMFFAIALFSHFFDALLRDPQGRSFLFSAFLGFVLASLWICYQKMGTLPLSSWCFFLFFFLVVLFFTLFAPSWGQKKIQTWQLSYPLDKFSTSQNMQKITNYDSHTQRLLGVSRSDLSILLSQGSIDLEDLVWSQDLSWKGRVRDLTSSRGNQWFYPWLIFCGALSISAMLLPGISGSYLLQILGVYPLIISTVSDLFFSFKSFTLDTLSLWILSNFVMGIMLGAAFFSRFILWLFKHYQRRVLASLMGCMLGALPVLWPFWEYEYHLQVIKPNGAPILNPLKISFPYCLDFSFFISFLLLLFSFAFIIFLNIYFEKNVSKMMDRV